MSNFITKLPVFQRKLFVTGIDADTMCHLTKILTDEQKQSVINSIDECFSQETQTKIIDKYINS